MIEVVLDQVKSGLTNSNLPRIHDYKRKPSFQAIFMDLETSKLQVQQTEQSRTKETAFILIYGSDTVLPIKVKLPSRRI